ncbi:MAG: pentapeptide repeat-containing protein [Gammaproteobacteria bacterium]
MTESHKPVMKADPMYQLLRDGKIKEFNALRAQGEACDLQGSDLRGLDLRGLDAQHLDLSNAYLRQADLRGVDLSTANLEGASVNGAKISGAYFPAELCAEEITLSLLHGTRMRYQCTPEPPPASSDA